MRNIGTRFSLVVGVFALAFSGVVFYRTWSSAIQHTEELTSTQAQLALEFDLAIREYAGEVIRPEMEKRMAEDEFVVETMSTSYIARHIVEKVRRKFPDYLLKFPSDNPRNPVNKAGPEEEEILRYFRENPDEDRWVGKLAANDHEYVAHVSAMRVEKSCLRCHGRAEDSPKSLLERYGPLGGFNRQVGDVAGMEMIAIPMDAVNASLASDARIGLLAAAAWLILLFASILVAFRLIVTRRLAAITAHFQVAAAQESGGVGPVPESGKDEISVLAHSFNSLAHRLRALHGSLEQQVRVRTEELSTANDHLRNEVETRKKVEEALRREQRLLKRSLQTHDRERRMIAYEIHDGLAQHLAGAVMAFQVCDPLLAGQPAETRSKYEAATAMLTRCLAETRWLINGVRPPLLDEEGVIVAVQNLLAEYANDGGPEVELRHSPDFGRLEPVLENAAYRIVQEGLTNARQHSGSEKIRVRLEKESELVRIEVQDWGVGFDVRQKKGKAMGLRGIRERAKLLGGQAQIESESGGGTRITVDLPLETPEYDADDSDF